MGFSSVLAVINRMLYRPDKDVQGSIYDFKVRSLAGEQIDFNQFKGKKLLIVNTASRCAYTPQLEDLQTLHEKFGDQVHVLGFPSNDFLWQEPGNNSEIASFCQRNFGVTFQLFEKMPVTGRNSNQVFRWLAAKSGESPTWNFCKYLVDESGQQVTFFNSKIKPLDKRITDKILAQR
jgi:glutathione peroxidase